LTRQAISTYIYITEMNWIKSHKFIIFLFVIIVFLFFKGNFNTPVIPLLEQNGSYNYAPGTAVGHSQSVGMDMAKTSSLTIQTPSINSSSRVVIQESNMSLLVTDVKQSGDKILNFAKDNGGYMVYASYSNPSESPFANITIRVPTNKLNQALSYFKDLAIKVTNENLVGTDVTQEYTDIEARLATLQKTQAKFEEILNKAVDIQDILTVQRELINLQDQIDSYVGQQKAIDKNAELTRITVYLSTDELALPYTPDTVFRPNVVFKYAVRSLLNNLRIGAEVLIWIAVYSPLIIVVILAYIFIKRWLKKRKSATN
jgi:hypothetical protein